MFIQLIIALVCVSIAAAGKVYYQEGELALQEPSPEAAEGMQQKSAEFRKNGGRLYIASK